MYFTWLVFNLNLLYEQRMVRENLQDDQYCCQQYLLLGHSKFFLCLASADGLVLSYMESKTKHTQQKLDLYISWVILILIKIMKIQNKNVHQTVCYIYTKRKLKARFQLQINVNTTQVGMIMMKYFIWYEILHQWCKTACCVFFLTICVFLPDRKIGFWF
jgi:hypothetical protein